MSKTSAENPVPSTVGWGADVLGVIGGINLFLPGPFKDFMLAHPLWAWAGLIGLIIAYRRIVGWYVRVAEAAQAKSLAGKVSGEHARLAEVFKAKETELSDRWIGEHARLAEEFKAKETELFRINDDKDVSLLNDRLKNMEREGDFHTYLAAGIDHKSLEYSFISQLEGDLHTWRRDWRQFFGSDVTKAWEKFTAAADDYQAKVSQYMWTKDDSDYLHVPPEWKSKDHKQYQTAFKELDTSRTALYVALNELHRIQHARGIAARQDASETPASPAGMARNNIVSPPPVPEHT